MTHNDTVSTTRDTDDDVSRRGFLQATGGVAAAAAVGGFAGTAAGADDAAAAAQERGRLRLINATMSSLDPVQATDTASGTVIQQVFDALMNYPDGRINVEPLIATGFERSDDLTTYTFQLKEGVQFHNGQEATAQDFRYAWERLVNSQDSRRAYFALDSIGIQHDEDDDGNYVPGSLGVETPDDYTVRINLEEPFHSTLPMLAYTAFAAVPEGLVGDLPNYEGEVSQSQFARNPVGCGPFVFEAWEPNTEAEVSRFGNYHGEGPQLAGVHWQIIEDDDAAYNYSMNQNVDVIAMPTSYYDPTKVSIEETDEFGRRFGTYGPLRNGETANYLAVPTINTFYVGFDTNRVDKAPRVAAAYAMNQEAMVQQVFKGRGKPAYLFTPPRIFWEGGVEGYDQFAQENYPYGYNEAQLGQARRIMQEAGYGPNNRYEFTFTTYESNTWQQVGGIMQDQLRSAFIDMNLEQAPFSTLIERGRSGNLQGYSLGWIMDWPAPDNFFQLLNPPLTDTSQAAPISYLNWLDTQASQRAREAWNTIESNPAPTDEAQQARAEAYREIELANWEDVAILPVYHETDERFWYQWLDIEPYGGAGGSRQMYRDTEITGEQG